VASARIANGFFIHPARQGEDSLHFHVIFTGLKETEISLRVAGELAHGLGGRLTLLVPEIVPYPLPLDCPPVQPDFTEQVLTRLVAAQEVETHVQVLLCRDRNQAIRQTLGPDSIVVIGIRKLWWNYRERFLASRLRLDGHHVIFLEGITN